MTNKYSGGYPAAWSPGEITLYEQLGKEPAKTSNGVWVGDVVREELPLNEWSMAELVALANGELYTSKVSGDDVFYSAVRAKALLEDSDAGKWGEEDLMNWLLYETPPAKSLNGYYIHDPERWVKDADAWHNQELVDLGLGFFGTELSRQQLYILDEASERFNLPMGITFDDYRHFTETGQYPLMTSNNLLVNDRRRAAKKAADWSGDELEAWALGEIESTTTGLLEKAIEHVGGEWYWGADELKSYLQTGEVPVVTHDYAHYTDEQLQSLIERENDQGAIEAYAERHPAVEETVESVALDEIIPEIVSVDETETVTPAQLTEIVSVFSESSKEPESDPVEEVVSENTEEEESSNESDDDNNDTIVTTHWSDVVGEDSPLYQAMVDETPEAVINDTERRRLLIARKWTVVELVGWARGLIEPGVSASEKTLIAALRAVCGVFAERWTDDAVKTFVASGEFPEGFTDRMLVWDIKRDRTHPGAWTEDELKAWARGDIKSTVDDSTILLSMRVHMNVPRRLTDEEARVFVATGELPEETIPPIDAGRPFSEAQWMAWIKGDLVVDESEHERIFAHIRSMKRIDVHWTNDHIINYFRHGKTPAVLEDGVMVEDRLRDLFEPGQWKWNELRHFYLGNIIAYFSIEDALPRIRRLIEVQFGTSPAHWSDDDVLVYLKERTKPKALEDGVYINDPTRALKPIESWRDAEIKAWLRGKIELPESISEEQAWEEIYVRFKVPVVWYKEDAKNYVLNGTEVKALPSGMWVRDRNRDNRPVKHWTRREVKAWARGQIQHGLDTNEKELGHRAMMLFGLSQFLDIESIKKRISNITEESVTMTVQFVLNDLESYAKGRKDAANNDKAAAPYQTLLDRCINRVVKLEGEDFTQGWTELLKFFHTHSKDICSLKQMYTGVGQMAITPKGLRNFQNMTTLLIRTCDPTKQAAAVKSIDFTATLKEITSEKSRQHLLSYYGIN